MNRRQKKKKIPKHTLYCDHCPFWQYIERTILCKDVKNPPYPGKWKECEYQDCEKGCWKTPQTSCSVRVVRCRYMKYTDEREESLLWDGCKECGISME